MAYDEITIPGTNDRPQIDGKLSDGEGYFKLHNFYDTDQFPTDRDADKVSKGVTYVTYDYDNLYVLIAADEATYAPLNNPTVSASGSCMYLAILGGMPDEFDENSQIQLAINLSEEGKQEYKFTGSVPEADRFNSVDAIAPSQLFEYITVRDEAAKITYYEVALPWKQLDRAGKYTYVEGHKFTFNYIVCMDLPNILQYGQGLLNDIYDGGGILTLGAFPVEEVIEVEVTPETTAPEAAVVAPTTDAPVATAPATADSGVIVFAILAVLAAAVVVATKKARRVR
jgi:hypothetical protein